MHLAVRCTAGCVCCLVGVALLLHGCASVPMPYFYVCLGPQTQAATHPRPPTQHSRAAAQMLCRCCTDAPLRSCSPNPTLPLLARSPPHSRTSPPSFVATRATDHERGHAASFPSAVLAFGRIQPRCRAGGWHASALFDARQVQHPTTTTTTTTTTITTTINNIHPNSEIKGLRP